MTAEKELIRREILAREQTIVGTVISSPEMLDYDQTVGIGGPVWVVTVEIGSNRPLRNVPIKGGSSGKRFFAQLGQTVVLRRNALGRFQVIGPGDRKAGILQRKTYSLDTLQEVSSDSVGFQADPVPFEYYAGPRSIKGNPDLTFAVTGGNDTITRDAGSWVLDGFVAGDSVRIQRSLLNDAVITVAAISGVGDDVLETAATLVAEGPTSGIAVAVAGTSLWNDGANPFNLVRILDSEGVPIA